MTLRLTNVFFLHLHTPSILRVPLRPGVNFRNGPPSDALTGGLCQVGKWDVVGVGVL